MTQTTPTEAPQEPIFLTLREAAAYLGGHSPYQIGQRCDEGLIESGWSGKRRLVVFESLKAYAESIRTQQKAS